MLQIPFLQIYFLRVAVNFKMMEISWAKPVINSMDLYIILVCVSNQIYKGLKSNEIRHIFPPD